MVQFSQLSFIFFAGNFRTAKIFTEYGIDFCCKGGIKLSDACEKNGVDLDKISAGLDPIAVEILKAKIKKEREAGKLILITSHIMSDLEELTNQAVYIFEGEVYFNDTIESLKEITGEDKFSPAIAKLMQWTLKKKATNRNLSHVETT